jgi:hypothetical protein
VNPAKKIEENKRDMKDEKKVVGNLIQYKVSHLDQRYESISIKIQLILVVILMPDSATASNKVIRIEV